MRYKLIYAIIAIVYFLLALDLTAVRVCHYAQCSPDPTTNILTVLVGGEVLIFLAYAYLSRKIQTGSLASRVAILADFFSRRSALRATNFENWCKFI